jgi:radical SAM superfamily enzyme YgiQ (UPF0313 family)
LKLLLVWPKARTDPDWGGDLGAIAEPLALEYLAAAAIAAGHDARILDMRLHPGDLEEVVDTYAPDIVGVTAFSMHVLAAVAICTQVKTWRPDCWTVAGGHHATFLPEDFFVDAIDFVVSGEGASPLAALLDALAANNLDALPGVPGLWYRHHGEFVLTSRRPAVDLEGMPMPLRSLTARDRKSYFIDWMKPVACIRSSVGCPYRCTFCSLWQITDGRYHMREADSFVDELRTVDEEFVFLVDDEAFINRRRMLKLADAIRESGIRKSFFAYCRMDTLVRQKDVLRAWRALGLDRLLIGIDAISPKDLQEYNKGYDSARIEEGLATARELGIEVFAQFVINPDYSPRDFDRLVRFVEHHKITYPSFTVLTPLPGTPLLKTFDAVTELQANGRPNWDFFDTQNAVTATRLPKDEFHRSYRNLFRRFQGSYTLHRSSAKPQRIFA